MGFTRAMAMTPLLAIVCVAAAAIVGLVSSLVPAWSAARTPIVESLRHAG
jgi:ABC-type lipoprotein release transport system permease subunit